jgi:hypothetical protein
MTNFGGGFGVVELGEGAPDVRVSGSWSGGGLAEPRAGRGGAAERTGLSVGQQGMRVGECWRGSAYGP